MNYELAICFLFILLFIIYFYIRKQPIIEGAGKSDPLGIKKFFKKIPDDIQKGTTKIVKDAEKKTTAEFNKAKKGAEKGVNIIKTELKKVKDSILKPILKFVKQIENFGKNLGRLFVDWANFISSNIMCAIKNVSNPVCLLWNVVRLVAYLFYAIVWLIILSFVGQSTADSFECIIIKIQGFLGKFIPQILKTCGKGCSAEIPLWGGKKLKSPADKTRSKCNAKSKSEFEEKNIDSVKFFYWVVLIFLVAYIQGLPSVVQKWFDQPPSNTVLNETNNPLLYDFNKNQSTVK
jgi:hypothetical protein